MGCVINVGDYPQEIGCLITAGFTATVHRRTKYLGAVTAKTQNPTITGNIHVKDKHRIDTIVQWWETTLNFGALPFYIDIKIFGIEHRAEIMLISGLNKVVIDSLFPVTMEIMNVDNALVRPNYNYELYCGFEISCDDELICT